MKITERLRNFDKKLRDTDDILPSFNENKDGNPILRSFGLLGIGILAIVGGIVAIIVTILFAPISYFLRKSEKKNKDRVIRTIEEYGIRTEIKGQLHFHGLDYSAIEANLILPRHLRDALRYFFVYNNIYATVYENSNYQCDPGRRRSLGDIYMVMKYYRLGTTIHDVLRELITLCESGTLKGCYCTTIKKYVFTPHSNYNIIDAETEYGYNIKFKEVIKAFKGL